MKTLNINGTEYKVRRTKNGRGRHGITEYDCLIGGQCVRTICLDHNWVRHPVPERIKTGGDVVTSHQ